MRNYIKYILVASIFITQNLFAQSTTDSKGMDMSTYTTWMSFVVIAMLLIMFAILVFFGDKEPSLTENAITQPTGVFNDSSVKIILGNRSYLLPKLNLELQRVKTLLASALIVFSIVLLLLLIQK